MKTSRLVKTLLGLASLAAMALVVWAQHPEQQPGPTDIGTLDKELADKALKNRRSCGPTEGFRCGGRGDLRSAVSLESSESLAMGESSHRLSEASCTDRPTEAWRPRSEDPQCCATRESKSRRPSLPAPCSAAWPRQAG